MENVTEPIALQASLEHICLVLVHRGLMSASDERHKTSEECQLDLNQSSHAVDIGSW